MAHASRFGIGQIVELDATGFLPGVALQTGDRGTIVSSARVNEFDELEVKVLWHKNSRESWMCQFRLRIYTYPMDPPGRSQGAGATVRALAKVIDVELPHAMEEVTRDLERARMTAEDLRGAAFSPYGIYPPTDPRHRLCTWREFGEERREKCSELCDRLVAAREMLDGPRAVARQEYDDAWANHREALKRAYNAMCDAERCLRDDDTSDESSD